MAGSQRAVAQLAAMGYMNSGMDPTLQMLTSGNPELFLSQASTVEQLNNQAGMRVTTLQHEQVAAQRAQATAREEIATVNQLKAEISGKVTSINAKMDILNSSAMTQAMAVFNKTGSYPDVMLPEATNVGTRALRAALTQRGEPYVWGAAGPRRLRLLRPRGLGLRPGGHLAAALHRGAVELRHARVPGRAGAGRPGVLLRRHQPRGHLHRQRPDGGRAERRPGRQGPADQRGYVGAVRIA